MSWHFLVTSRLFKGPNPCEKLRRRRCGFTLVEVLVVVLITGVLAGSVSLTLLTRARSATVDDWARRIVFLDATARHTARRTGHAQRMMVNLDKGQMTSLDLLPDESGLADDSNSQLRVDASNWTQHLRLPNGFRIDHVWWIDPTPDAEASVPGYNQAQIHPDALGQTEGQFSMTCSADGYTPSYAMALSGPQSQRRWIVVPGLSGQACIASDERQVRSLLQLQSGQPTTAAASIAREQMNAR